MPFTKLGLAEPIVANLAKLGFQKPTPIQEQAIPLLLSGKDLLATSQTGTGKTAAFGLPLVSQLLAGKGGVRCLILEPTRELAQQVEAALKSFCAGTPLRVVAIFGGVGYGFQRKAIQQGVDIVVATPGRLEDLLQQNHIRLQNVQHLVIDEVDRMLDIGFLPAVKRIVQKCPTNRQTCVFSATLPPQIKEIAAQSLRQDHGRVAIQADRTVAETIEHWLYPINAEQKFDLLAKILDELGHDKLIIFTRTKHGADRVSRQLFQIGHSTTALHSNRTQRQREQALMGLKMGKYRVLVATDIASRGIDIRQVSHVINYDVPEHPEDYVHRIGRTGRAENTGDALTFVTPDEEIKVARIERLLGQTITRKKVEGFEYKTPPRMEGGRPRKEDHQRNRSSSHRSHGGHRGGGRGRGGNRGGRDSFRSDRGPQGRPFERSSDRPSSSHRPASGPRPASGGSRFEEGPSTRHSDQDYRPGKSFGNKPGGRPPFRKKFGGGGGGGKPGFKKRFDRGPRS